MKTCTRLLIPWAVLLGFSPLLSAQTTWYTVEVLVFQHLSDAGLYAEHWPAEPGAPAVEEALSLSLEAGGGGEQTDDRPAFRLLGRSALQLGEAAGRLKRSAGYRPLLHVAWLQPGYTRSDARKVHIHTNLPNRFRTTGELDLSDRHVVDGTLRLSRARYLHLEADLLHQREIPIDAPINVDLFRLQESRRMRSREVHYIDHPLFGLLVLVTPYEPVEEDIDDEELSESSE